VLTENYNGRTIEISDDAPHWVRWRTCARDEQLVPGFGTVAEARAFALGAIYTAAGLSAAELKKAGYAVSTKPELVEVVS